MILETGVRRGIGVRGRRGMGVWRGGKFGSDIFYDFLLIYAIRRKLGYSFSLIYCDLLLYKILLSNMLI